MTKSTGVGRGAGAGRPTTYKPEFCRIAKEMAQLGATDREIAHALGISEKCFYLWTARYPKFVQAVKLGKTSPNERAERSLFMRATGYSYDSEEIYLVDEVTEIPGKTKRSRPTIIRTKKVLRVPVVKHVPPGETSLIFFLKNRKKDEWRDFKATELSTPPGRPLEFAATGEPELIGQYYARLGRAGPVAATSAPSGAHGADPGADQGVGKGGQKPQGQGGRSKADKG
jgi:hypothetical protein